MVKRVIIAGLFGGLVMIGWTFVVNGIFGFRVALDMNRITNERQVYELLEASIREPGRYICNPEVTGSGFPPNRPVFSVIYGGVGHEAAGMTSLIHLPIAFVAPMIVAWMLLQASSQVLSRYSRKVFFFTAVGVLLGLLGRAADFGIGGYPLQSALILFVHEIALWTAIGLVMAWKVKP
jgi:hypothetical protein